VEVAKNYFIKGFAMIKLILIKYLPATYNSYGDGGGDGGGNGGGYGYRDGGGYGDGGGNGGGYGSG